MGRVDTLVADIGRINRNYENVLSKLDQLNPQLESANKRLGETVTRLDSYQTETKAHIDTKFDSILEVLNQEFASVVEKVDTLLADNNKHIEQLDKITTTLKDIDAAKLD